MQGVTRRIEIENCFFFSTKIVIIMLEKCCTASTHAQIPGKQMVKDEKKVGTNDIEKKINRITFCGKTRTS